MPAYEFAYALDGEWRRVGPVLDASILSDEAAGGEHRSFTGAFVGMFAFGAAGGAISADFRNFGYEATAGFDGTSSKFGLEKE